ncbi:hypothetical protein ACQ86G_24980 [Roseateles chitinivorans]|uniref:hypothetical protein n=1 Tax=Roseateles chitinivorans TaxID=2917965 RepID=UPI003D678379
MGEITLRDSLIVAAATAGAQMNQAWVHKREVIPAGWIDSAVDLVVHRIGHKNVLHVVGGVELKWWRHQDKSNASNRRRDLVRDFVRAAALYPQVEDFSFVALLSTEVSWATTTTTTGADASAMTLLTANGTSKWNLQSLRSSPAVKGAVRSLNGKVPVPNIFHSKLLSTLELHLASGRSAFARVWLITKPQKTHFFDANELHDFLQ